VKLASDMLQTVTTVQFRGRGHNIVVGLTLILNRRQFFNCTLILFCIHHRPSVL